MENQVQVFGFEGNEVRVVVRGGEPWCVAKDVCDVLGLGNITETLKRLDEDEFSTAEVIDALGRRQQTYVVSEPGVYGIVMLSRKPEAKAFKRWVTPKGQTYILNRLRREQKKIG